VVVLLHGLTASADLNWGPSYAALGDWFRVIALDQRGHGGGIAPELPFRLETCADDVAALASALGIERFLAVGYSMGGIVAQLLWRRHRHLVQGLVLCSTGADFRVSGWERIAVFSTFSAIALARLVPPLYRTGLNLVGELVVGPMDDPVHQWVGSHLRRSSLATTASAAQAVSGFSSTEWIGEVDVPTAVVVTTRDRVIAPARQLALTQAIPNARSYLVEEGHSACVGRPDHFVPVLLEACCSVSRQ
jgi:pimeloyl-ACP methyl ester carboxylesterase